MRAHSLTASSVSAIEGLKVIRIVGVGVGSELLPTIFHEAHVVPIGDFVHEKHRWTIARVPSGLIHELFDSSGA